MNTSVILVHTQIGENIGLCARAMNAFGIERLVLVDPQCETDPASTAYKTASGSSSILDNARVFPTLREALADVHIALAFSRRPHDFHRPTYSLRDIRRQQADWQGQSVALVFGSENFGLQNEEKRLCDAIVSIPLAHETLSLNLGQAVSVALYEWSGRESIGEAEPSTRITHEEQEHILDRVVALLDETPFFKAGRRDRQIEIVRNLIQRMAMTSDERPTAMGILKVLDARLLVRHGKVDRLK